MKTNNQSSQKDSHIPWKVAEIPHLFFTRATPLILTARRNDNSSVINRPIVAFCWIKRGRIKAIYQGKITVEMDSTSSRIFILARRSSSKDTLIHNFFSDQSFLLSEVCYLLLISHCWHFMEWFSIFNYKVI